MAKAPDVVDLLALAVERGASDLVITVGLPPMLKIDGEFHPTEYEPLPPGDPPPHVRPHGREAAADL